MRKSRASLYSRIQKSRDALVASGKTPNSIFMNRHSALTVAAQAQIPFPIDSLLEMKVYISEQYLDDAFRIYCEPTGGS